MTKARQDGLYLAILGALIFVLIGTALENAAPVSTVDFRVVYYSARCLLEHHDPYNISELQGTYQSEHGETAKDTPTIRLTETQYIYPPTAFSITALFALLPFWPAHILWLVITAFSVMTAAFLMWHSGAKHSPLCSGILTCLMLANSELFLILGNPAGLAISFCVIAAWCFVERRFVAIGVVCLALSLALKPHDSVFVWVYFFLAGGFYRKWALQSLAALFCLALPATLWVTHIAPHWIHELSLNLAANSAHGGLSDPGPASMAAHGIGMVISLQSVFSMLWDNQGFYNLASYLVSGALLLSWFVQSLQTRARAMPWYALAPIAALTMLPIYHRLYDAKLLLLAVPACCMLWERGQVAGRVAFVLTAGSLVLTGGVAWAFLLQVIAHLRLPANQVSRAFLIAVQVFPVPILLLAVSIFYLWIYIRLSRGSVARQIDPKFARESH